MGAERCARRHACPGVRPPQTPSKQRGLPVSSWPPRGFGLVAPGPRGAASPPALVLRGRSPGGSDSWGASIPSAPQTEAPGALPGSCVPQGAARLPGEKPAGLQGLGFPSPPSSSQQPLEPTCGTSPHAAWRPLAEACVTLTAPSSASPGEVGRGLLPPASQPALPSPPVPESPCPPVLAGPELLGSSSLWHSPLRSAPAPAHTFGESGKALL